MSYELISDEEFANLPIDNDQCFVEFERICRRNMTRMIDENSGTDFDKAIRQQYMTAVAAVAQERGIPNISYDFGDDRAFWDDFARLSLSVQGEVARFRIRQRGERHPYSVLLTGSTRTKIEHYILRIRELIKTSDLDHDHRIKLDQLAKELGSQRLNFAKSLSGVTALKI